MASNQKLKADKDHGVIDHINDLGARISALEYKTFGKVFESSHADPKVLEVEKSDAEKPVPEDHAAKFESGAKVKFINHGDKLYTVKEVTQEPFPGDPFFYSLEEVNGVFAEDALAPEFRVDPPVEQYQGNAGDGGEHRAEHQNLDEGYNDKTDGPVVESHDSAVEIAGGNAQSEEEMRND